MNRESHGIGNGGFSGVECEYIRRHHHHEPGENQCSSALVKRIKAPVPLVISLSLSLSLARPLYIPVYVCMHVQVFVSDSGGRFICEELKDRRSIRCTGFFGQLIYCLTQISGAADLEL